MQQVSIYIPPKDEDEKDGLEKKDGDKAKQRRWWWWKTGAGTPEHKKQGRDSIKS